MNPLLDMREYEVALPDDRLTVEYVAKVIAENLYSQCDSKGCKFVLIKEIIGHWKDDITIIKDDGYIVSKNGNKVKKKMTKG